MRNIARPVRDLSPLFRNAIITPQKMQTAHYWHDALSFTHNFSKKEWLAFLSSKGHWIYPGSRLFNISVLFPRLYDYFLESLTKLELTQDELLNLFFISEGDASENIFVSILDHWSMATFSDLCFPPQNMNIDCLKKTFDFLCPRLTQDSLVANTKAMAKLLILPGDAVDFLNVCVESLSRNNLPHQAFLSSLLECDGEHLVYKMALAKNYKLMSYLSEKAEKFPKKQLNTYDDWLSLTKSLALSTEISTEISNNLLPINTLDAYSPAYIDSSKVKTLPLIWAVKNGYLKLAQILIAMGVDVDTSYENETPLIVAIKNHQHACIDCLLTNNANFKLTASQSASYDSPLLIAIRHKDLRACQLLVNAGENPCRIFYQNLLFNQDLIGYIAFFGDLNILQFMISKGVEGDFTVALRAAVLNCQSMSLIRFLINRGAVADARLLHDAINVGYPEAVNFFLSCGVDRNERIAGETALEKAKNIGNAELLWVLETQFTERFFRQWVVFCFMFCKHGDSHLSGKLIADLFLDKWLLPGSMRPEQVYSNCARIFDRVSRSFQENPIPREPLKPSRQFLGQSLGWR